MHRSTYAILFLLLCFGLFKVFRFQTLGYTFNDMYAFIQMSCSYLDGRPFMFDNIWGYHHRIHNYYTVLLWGPLCYSLGAYGLLLVQIGWLTVSYCLVHKQLLQKAVPVWVRWSLFGVILLGPVSFWLNDHPNIGWHTELTYLPFALLFALALSQKNLLTIILSGTGLVLVKEDGAVLALCIHITAFVLHFVKHNSRAPMLRIIRNRAFWLIGLAWSITFLIGMWWIRFKNHDSEPRLQKALTQLNDHVSSLAFWQQLVFQFGYSLLLLSPIICLLGLIARQLPKRIMLWLSVLYAGSISILSVLNFVQSAHYYNDPLFYLVSLTWPPRFVLLWGYSCAFLTLTFSFFHNKFKPIPLSTVSLIMSALFLLQIPILHLVRPDFITLREIKATIFHQIGAGKNPIYVAPEDLNAVHCIAEQLPPRSSVFVSDYLTPYFHNHYEIWPTGNQWQPADISILPTNNFQGLNAQLKLVMKSPYQTIRLKGYTIYTTPEFFPYVERCLQND